MCLRYILKATDVLNFRPHPKTHFVYDSKIKCNGEFQQNAIPINGVKINKNSTMEILPKQLLHKFTIQITNMFRNWQNHYVTVSRWHLDFSLCDSKSVV